MRRIRARDVQITLEGDPLTVRMGPPTPQGTENALNRSKWNTRQRIQRIRRRRTHDFDRYNPQIPLPFSQSFRPSHNEGDREKREEY